MNSFDRQVGSISGLVNSDTKMFPILKELMTLTEAMDPYTGILEKVKESMDKVLN